MSGALIPSAALEGLLQKAFVDRSVVPGLFWDALLKSNLYVPLSERIKPTPADPARTEEEIPLLMGVDSAGKHVVWLFTSPDAMREYTEQDLPYREAQSTVLLASVQNSEHEIVLIGPDGVTLSLHPDLIKALAEGRVPDPPEKDLRTIEKDAPVYVGKPTEDVTALEKVFTNLFKQTPEVTEACFIQIADDTGPRLLLGLRLKEESREHLRHVAERVAAAAEGVLVKGQQMDITLMDRSLKEAFAKWGTSFYKVKP